MRNKRGLSGIIVTLITILLAMVAIGIVWVVVSNLIGNYTEKIEMGVNTMTLKVIEASNYSTNLTIKIKRNIGEGNMSKLKVLVYNDLGESFIYDLDFILKESETKIVTVSYSGIAEISKIEIAPIAVSSSGKEFVGTTSEAYVFP